MTDKPSKSAKARTKSTGPETPAASRRKRTVQAPEPTHDEIAERAYPDLPE